MLLLGLIYMLLNFLSNLWASGYLSDSFLAGKPRLAYLRNPVFLLHCHRHLYIRNSFDHNHHRLLIGLSQLEILLLSVYPSL